MVHAQVYFIVYVFFRPIEINRENTIYFRMPISIDESIVRFFRTFQTGWNSRGLIRTIEVEKIETSGPSNTEIEV